MRIRKLLAAMVVAVLGLLSLSAAPAQAGGPDRAYPWEFCDLHPEICHPLYVIKPFKWWPRPPECPVCGVMVDWRWERVLPISDENAVRGDIISGMSLLSRAAFTTDAALRTQLRATALAQFTDAARHSQGVGMAPGGWTVVKQTATGGWQVFQPTATLPWLDAAAGDIADGMDLIRLAVQNPGLASRYQALAMGQFDEAYSELSRQEVIGG